MKVAVVAPSSVPFVLGGAERLWNGLTRAINESTEHDAELIKLPTPEHTLPDVIRSYQAWAGLDVSHFDLVISTKYPAWMVDHPNHVVYLQHTLRGLYDTYPASLATETSFAAPPLAALEQALSAALTRGRAGLGDVFDCFESALDEVGADHPAFAFPGPLARRLVHTLDAVALAPGAVKRHYAISATVAGRRDYFPPGVTVGAVHHPSDLTDFRCEGFDYFFTASRLDGPKRLHLLVEAMRHVPGDVPLKIAGIGPEMERLEALAGDDHRIEFLGYVTSEQLLDLYAGALAVPFIPADEDLGLITLEAMMSGKPVITTGDSGGPTELVADGGNGFVVDPNPDALAAALTRLARDPALAEQLGAAGRQRAAAVTWERVVTTLLGEDSSRAGASKSDRARPARVTRPWPRAQRLAVVSTFPIHPRRGGGQLRCFYLYRELAKRFDVEAVSLAGPGEEKEEFALAERFVETVVPKSRAHEAAELELTRSVGVPITDIAASLLIAKTPAYLEALARACQGADAALLAHPFLHPAVKQVMPGLPVVYDAHNAEFALKRTILPETPAGMKLLDAVREVEQSACRDAVVVSVCSTEDEALLTREYDLDPSRILLVPNGVDAADIGFISPERKAAAKQRWLDRYQAMTGRGGTRQIAVFTGSWHLPNIDAGVHVIEMAEQFEDVLFLLVGGHCSHFEDWDLPGNVLLLGVVSDAVKEAVLAAADVALNPMVRGSGTNLKIVEYFAAGTPVVSTRLGSRGLAVRDGVHLAVGEIEDHGFAKALRSVLDDPTGAAEMARCARALVEEEYHWRVGGERLLERLAHALPERRRFG